MQLTPSIFLSSILKNSTCESVPHLEIKECSDEKIINVIWLCMHTQLAHLIMWSLLCQWRWGDFDFVLASFPGLPWLKFLSGNEANWQGITAMAGSSHLQWGVDWNTWVEVGVWRSMKRRMTRRMTWEPDNEIHNKQSQHSPHCTVQRHKIWNYLWLKYSLFSRLPLCQQNSCFFLLWKTGRGVQGRMGWGSLALRPLGGGGECKARDTGSDFRHAQTWQSDLSLSQSRWERKNKEKERKRKWQWLRQGTRTRNLANGLPCSNQLSYRGPHGMR